MKKFDKEYHKKWRSNNKERVKKAVEKYNNKYPERVKKAQKIWKQKNPKYNEEWLNAHPQYKDYFKNWGFLLKLEVFTHYSFDPPKCVLCGFDDIRALALDHINDDGAKHRISEKTGKRRSGRAIYGELKKRGYPEGYQILCANCNMVKEIMRREKEYEKKE